MQGTRKGVTTQIQNEVPAAIPVHCFTHVFKMLGKKSLVLHDALDNLGR